MRGTGFTAVFGAAIAGALGAQDTAKPPTLRLLVDRVVATVNDSAILESNLRAVSAGPIAAHITQYGGITPNDRMAILQTSLQRMIDDYRLAKAAASLGPLSPEQVDQIVQSELDRARIAQERDMGVNEMSRELKRTNRTLATEQNERRIDHQKKLAEDMTVGRRLARQANLYVTPRMLREMYQETRSTFFEREAKARVVQLRFTGPDAQQRAAEAAALWRKDGLDLRQLAARFPGALVIGEMSVDELASDLTALRQFALAGPEGAVSEPVSRGGDFLVARVTQFTSERHGRFEDPDVQRELQQLCTNIVVREFRGEVLKRAKDRTEVWRLR